MIKRKGNIKKIKKIGFDSVYNMTVSDVHNYMIQGNVIVKNCDSLRCFCVYWTSPADPMQSSETREWTDDMWEDYNNARTEEDRQRILKVYGVPR